MSVLVKRYTRSTEEFHRKLILPAEDKRAACRPTTAWYGGYRYFRSPNVEPIEHYRLSGRSLAPRGVGVVLNYRRRNRP